MTQHLADERVKTKKQTPLERFLALPLMDQAKYYQRGNYAMACCPVHGDHEPSLLVKEDDEDGHVVLVCFAGCARADICAALGITESDLYKNARPRKLSSEPERRLSVLDLAIGKLIHPSVLAVLEVEDDYTYRTADGTNVKHVVKIPYFNEDGTKRPRSRVRTAVSAGSGSFWDGLETDKIAPYGLHKLQEARDVGYLWLPEGESDCWTNWMHGVPALGIPGATNTATLQASHLKDIPTLYVVREPQTPGKKGDAGRSFVEGLRKRLCDLNYQGEVYIVDLKDSHGVKDLNDLHQKLFAEGRLRDYQSELSRAIHEATPLSLTTPMEPQQEHLAIVQPLLDAALAGADPAAIYELTPRLAGLEPKDMATVMAHITAATTQQKIPGFSKRDLNRLIKEEMAARVQSRPNRPRVVNRRDILLTGDIEEDAEAALLALYAANAPAQLFVRGARLTRCRITEEGRPFIEDVNVDMLLYEMSHVARFLHFSQQKGTYVPTYPPIAVARHILAQRQWKFPPLRGITEVPIVRQDGSILDQPGYDPQSRLIYFPHPDLVIPPIPKQPTQQEMEDAREYVWNFFAQFSYESQADAANAFGALLTTVTRSLYDLCPMLLIDGVKPGCGKTLWVQAHAAVALGRIVASSTIPQDETEWKKTITSHVLAGNTYLSFDNIRGLLRSAELEAFLTSPFWAARVLGTMQAPDMLQRMQVVGNGNNLEIGGDLARRCVRVRLTTMSSQPWMQTNFHFSPLLKHVQLNRGKIIASLLTLVRAWVGAGKPRPSTIRALGTFSEWSETIGSILAYINIPGFLDNLADLYNETDNDNPQWTAFLEYWEQHYGARSFAAGEIIDKLKNDKDFAELLPTSLATDFLNESKSFAKRLGKALRDRKGTPYGPRNTSLKRSEDKHKKQSLWRAISAPNAGTKPRLWVITGGMGDEEQRDEARAQQRQQEVPGELLSPESQELGQQEDEAKEETDSDRCEASACQDALAHYDPLGNAWCEHHNATRGELMRLGGELDPPYPRVHVLQGHMIADAENMVCWSAFTKAVPESDVLHALTIVRELHRSQIQQRE